MQSLHREGELLPATQREVLSAMLREHGATVILHTIDAQTPQHRRSFTASSDGSLSGGTLAMGNRASPGIPRHNSGLARRPSELGPSISGDMIVCLSNGFECSTERQTRWVEVLVVNDAGCMLDEQLYATNTYLQLHDMRSCFHILQVANKPLARAILVLPFCEDSTVAPHKNSQGAVFSGLVQPQL